MFVSAALLFLMEPMFAKMALPLLGGTPAVWNTCLMFFQAVLLCGYSYAHLSARLLSRRGQARLHLIVLIGALLTLPFRVPAGWAPPARHNPVVWLLLVLAVAVGAPFFALSASTPLLQKWFSHSDTPRQATLIFFTRPAAPEACLACWLTRCCLSLPSAWARRRGCGDRGTNCLCCSSWSVQRLCGACRTRQILL